MLIDFFFTLKDARVPVSIKEFLHLLEALQKNVIGRSIDEFYFLARLTLVKDEAHYDKFDRAFAAYFRGIETLYEKNPEIPLDWLERRLQRELTPQQRAALRTSGYQELMERLRELLEEQKERHEGGSKWIGTGGSSPYGNGGENPRGVRIGGEGSKRSAVKVWDRRTYRDYDSSRDLGTRNIKMALRRLRRFARQGARDELALDDTIRATASNAGFLDLRMRAERRNNTRVLMLFDVGGSMDDHVARTEELFSAARGEFKDMEFFYFHNCIYDHVWKSNRRRHDVRHPSWEILRKYPADTRLIIVGDATMSPYEISQPGGSVEENNEEAGATWITRFTTAFPRAAWLNPEPEGFWRYRQSIDLIRQLMGQRMYPLTIEGLERAMRSLAG